MKGCAFMTSLSNLPINNGATVPALGLSKLAAINGLETGIRGGPDPDFVTLDNFNPAIPQA